MQSSWPQLFNHPLFRKGWEDHIAGRSWTEQQLNSVVYIFGRMLAAESGRPLPHLAEHVTSEMSDIIRACPMFERQMMVAQWLQAGKDPSKLGKALGTKQGDET